ncbi:hypothetical protein WA171_005837 [Blastocystis sp. BT1]
MTLDKTEPVSSEHVENIESNNEERVEMKGIVEGTTLPVEEPPKESILDLQENTAEIVPEQEPEVSHSDEMGPEKFVAEKKSDEITLDLVESNSVDKPSGEEKSGEVIVASEVMELVEDPTERPAEELNPVILSDSDSDDILQVPPEAWTGEDSEEFKEEKREIMLKLVHEKRDAVMNKIRHINLLHQQIADLDKPAAQDVSRLRHKIDSCFRQIWSLECSLEEAKEAVKKSLEVQEKLQEQRIALNEKKKTTIFDFENKHLQQLKEIEEEIRGMSR